MTKRTFTIDAAVIGGNRDRFHIETLELEGPRDDEVLVRLKACGICHTDIDFARDASMPTVFGHEGAGIVEQVGPDVAGIEVGDAVLLSYANCGQCGACQGDAPYDCDLFWELNFGFMRLDGTSAYEPSGVRGHFFGQSSFATHALATVHNIVRIDSQLPLELLAPLGCGLQTGAGTVCHVFDLQPGTSIVIFGVGTVGLGALMAARILGATALVAVDTNPERLTLAAELGATHTFQAEEHESLSAALGSCVASGFDYAIDTSGTALAAATLHRVIGKHGRSALLAGGDIIQGNSIAQRFIPQMIDWYRQGRFPLERLITPYAFHDIEQAIEDAREGRVIKAVLNMAE